MRTTFAALALSMLSATVLQSAVPIWVYIGTYTRGGDSEGIYLSQLDLGSGALSAPVLAAEADNPSFLAISPDCRHLYAVEETADFSGESSGALRSFTIDPSTGKLAAVNTVPTSGAHPCHVVTDQAGRHALFANYTGGSAGAFHANEEGKLDPRTAFAQHQGSSVNAQRQKGPHAHSINLDPGGRFAFVADLGLDQVVVYRFGPEAGTLIANDPPFAAVKPGGGPRHFAFRPDAKFAYVNNEMTSSVTAFAYDASNGSLKEIQTLSTLPDGHEGRNSTAEIRVHPSGRLLYVSNRGHNSIAIFEIDAESGELSPVGHQPSGGKTPRNFNIDPSGNFLLAANQNSNNVVVFRIDLKTGKLTPTGSEVTVPAAVCVRFLQPPWGAFERLFDGETTKGWKGKAEWFRVEDGCVVAGSLEKRIPNNEFLVTEREFGDFELRFEAKLVGAGNNAGVQFWSQRIRDHHEMIGFQCDIGDMGGASIWGALYDESRRRKFLAQVPLPTQRITAKKDEWNQFRIVARGDAITIWVNGGLAAQWFETEPDDKIPRNGRIGLQIHSGAPLEAWYRKIELREL